MSVIWLLAGLAALTVGAELLVRGASALARAVGLPPLIIGLTIVAYGTSAPEFATSVKAALAGQADLAVGNVVGSNAFNVLFILGVSALIAPLAVSSQLVRLDVPVMIGASAVTWAMAANGWIGRAEGAVLVGAACVYTALLVYLGKRNPPPGEETDHQMASPEPASPKRARRLGLSILLVLAGLGLLVAGAGWLVRGAVEVARLMGVSELVIGLTIVAGGTSLPEVATSVVASIRGERDIAVGNVVGSNIFNLLAVLGGAALVTKGGIHVADAALRFDIPIMLAVAVACLPIFLTGGRICRWEGGLFLGYYVAYVAFLIFSAMHHRALAPYGMVMLWFVIPLTVLGVAVSLLFWLRRPRGTGG